MIKRPLSRNYQTNQQHLRDSQAPCVVCGKGIAPEKQTLMVHMVWGGAMLALPGEVAEGEPGEMGYFPIGPDCLKKHPELRPYVTLCK